MPNNLPIVIIARLKAEEGLEEDLLTELRSLVEASKKEEGCIQYILHKLEGVPTDFMIYEIWKSQKALDEHTLQPHYQNFSFKAASMLAEQPTIDKFEQAF
ncbi:putative quinol monooxygenase [Pseudomonas putida]|uniref:putative quinol monooxygenase n=1 Tax=Pseudomonas putida TaxID=303 RepID=UPI0027751F0F|nr:putative quinol monooxygenase [Pseudomonas putida]MDP9524499.1 putative quinol monooxygenase [Pseudomonas putida]